MTEDELIETARDLASKRADAMTALIAAISAARASQPERLQEMRDRTERARDASSCEEPWDSLWSALPGINSETGELAGMLALPSIAAKELFGTRLAFDLAAYAGDEDSIDGVVDWYFSAVKSTDHLFLIAMSALKMMALHVVPILLEIAEESASNWDVRVNLSDAARNSWEQRVKSFEGGAA
ncbi:hypothetical protein [Nocardia sp. NPDC051463]|uniref:hypothetical protein n=1 Tax=Nocardia sp. NPDC051463 TaxID=3154845 RepID=UPI00344C64DD